MTATLTIILDKRYEIAELQHALDRATEAVQMALNDDCAIAGQSLQVSP